MSYQPTEFTHVELATVPTNEEKTEYEPLSSTECCGEEQPVAVDTEVGAMEMCANCEMFL